MSEKLTQEINLIKLYDIGGKIQTYDGFSARILDVDRDDGGIQVQYTDLNENLHIDWMNADGTYKFENRPFVVPKGKPVWIPLSAAANVYQRADGSTWMAAYKTEAQANAAAKSAKSPRIACIRYNGVDILQELENVPKA